MGSRVQKRPNPTISAIPTTHTLNMSSERELAEKFKEAVEARNIDRICPYFADGMTYQVLPSTFVADVVDDTSWILSVLMQDREENGQG